MRLVWLLILLASSGAWAAIDVHEFDSDVQRMRYQSFIDEMRCPKCQNQNLSGSDAPIAVDLRRELYLMIQDGRSDKEIVDFMVERYGEYILYRPRISAATYVLWFGPVVLLITGIIVLLAILHRRRQLNRNQETRGLTRAEQAHLAQLLEAANQGSQGDSTSPATESSSTGDKS